MCGCWNAPERGSRRTTAKSYAGCEAFVEQRTKNQSQDHAATNIIDGSRRIAVTDSKVACLRVIIDSATRIQYSPISLLRKNVRGNVVPSKRIRDSGGLFDPCVLGD